MEFVDYLLRGDTNCADKELRLLLDDNINELGKLALRVVILRDTFSKRGQRCTELLTFVFRACPPTCGMSRSTPNGALGSSK